jgi:ribosome assembly protein 1
LKHVTSVLISRPLTADGIAQRRELLRQKQAEKTTTAATTTSDEPSAQPTDSAASTKENETVDPETTDDNMFLAFARVYSGRLKRGQKIFALSPRHGPTLFLGKVSSPVPRS